MNDRLLILLALIAVPIYILLFWNFVRSIMVMGQKSAWWGIAGFLFSPISQIIFHLFNGNMLSVKENKVFKVYYWLMGFTFISGIALSVIMPSLLSTDILVEENDAVESIYVNNIQPSSILPVEPNESNERDANDVDIDESYQKTIDNAHPDARAIVASSDFSSWLQSLPTSLSSNFDRILSEGDAKEVIYMLDEFEKYRKAREYENDIEYKEVQMSTQSVATPTYYNQGSAAPEQNAEQQIAANKKTMRVFIEAQGLDKKRALIGRGYTEQQAEEYIKEWVQQKVNKL